MSWHSNKSSGYDRQDAHEITHYYITLFEDQQWDGPYYSAWDDNEEDDWFFWGRSGYVSSMDEYHGICVLTLLRKLSLGIARKELKERGW